MAAVFFENAAATDEIFIGIPALPDFGGREAQRLGRKFKQSYSLKTKSCSRVRDRVRIPISWPGPASETT